MGNRELHITVPPNRRLRRRTLADYNRSYIQNKHEQVLGCFFFFHSWLLNCETSLPQETVVYTRSKHSWTTRLQELKRHAGGPGSVAVASHWKWDPVPGRYHCTPALFGHSYKNDHYWQCWRQNI